MNIIGDRYQIDTKKIGSGGFSEVYLGRVMETDEVVAIKKIALNQKSLRNEKDRLKLIQEVELMQSLEHPNIVRFIDIIKTPTDWYIIMEYCNAGTLEDIIEEQRSLSGSEMIRENNTKYYLQQLCSALAYLRQKGYFHRDLKPLNILLSDRVISGVSSSGDDATPGLVLKLADFGLSRAFDDEEELVMTICGSPLYMAPEIVIDKTYNSQADLWSIGIIMYQLLFGILPYRVNTFRELSECLRNERIDFHTERNYSSNCFHLLKMLLTKRAESRITWDEFFDHPWFSSSGSAISEPMRIGSSRHDSRLSHEISPKMPWIPIESYRSSPQRPSRDTYVAPSAPVASGWKDAPPKRTSVLSNPSGLSIMKGSNIFRPRPINGYSVIGPSTKDVRHEAASCPESRKPSRTVSRSISQPHVQGRSTSMPPSINSSNGLEF